MNSPRWKLRISVSRATKERKKFRREMSRRLWCDLWRPRRCGRSAVGGGGRPLDLFQAFLDLGGEVSLRRFFEVGSHLCRGVCFVVFLNEDLREHDVHLREVLVRPLFGIPRALLGVVKPIQPKACRSLDEARDPDTRVKRQGLSGRLDSVIILLILELQGR